MPEALPARLLLHEVSGSCTVMFLFVLNETSPCSCPTHFFFHTVCDSACV